MSDDQETALECDLQYIDKQLSGYVPLPIRQQILNKMIADFPDTLKNRLKALKKLQLEGIKLEAEFYAKVHELEFEYHYKHSKLFDKRERIVNGTHEPTAEESDFDLDVNDVSDKLSDLKIYEIASKKVVTASNISADTTGIPDFWLQIFRNVFLLNEMVQDHDEPALRHLLDVKVIYLKDPMGFVLEFHFSPNEYFSNSVLTKEYIMSCEPKDDDPFSFEGPDIISCNGCKIDWYKGKNLTMKIVRKKQKHKSRDSMRTITKQVPNDSFFNFFNPPKATDDCHSDEEEDVQQLLQSDYEIAHYLRERVIPRAVLYYTGEGIEDEEEGDDDEEEEEDEGSFEEEEDEDETPNKGKKMGKGENPECKQQ